MRVVWSPRPKQRLAEAAARIAVENPEAARRLVEGIGRAVERLRDFPESGRVVPEVGRREVREVIYEGHRIIYRVEKGQVTVRTVRHGRRGSLGSEY